MNNDFGFENNNFDQSEQFHQHQPGATSGIAGFPASSSSLPQRHFGSSAMPVQGGLNNHDTNHLLFVNGLPGEVDDRILHQIF